MKLKKLISIKGLGEFSYSSIQATFRLSSPYSSNILFFDSSSGNTSVEYTDIEYYSFHQFEHGSCRQGSVGLDVEP